MPKAAAASVANLALVWIMSWQRTARLGTSLWVIVRAVGGDRKRPALSGWQWVRVLIPASFWNIIPG